MRGIAGLDPGWGITAVRLVMGIILVVAGWQKWSAGMSGVANNFAKMGIPAPGVSGPFIAILELTTVNERP